MIDSIGVEWPDEIWVHRWGETARYFYSTTSIPPGAFYRNEFEYEYNMPMQVYFSFPSQIECLTEGDAENECIKWLTEKLTRRGFTIGSVQSDPTISNLKMIQAIGRINRAPLEERTQRAFATHQDVKIPDEPHYLHQLGLSSKEVLRRINDLPDGFLDNLKDKTLIDKDLLQEIRNALSESWDDDCSALVFKLDSLYPYLKQS